MEITLTFAWWWIPLAITILTVLYAMSYDDGDSLGSGITNILLLVPAFFISMIAWIIAGMLK